MKRILTAFCTLLLCMLAAVPLTARGIQPIDPDKPSSLTVHYQYEQQVYPGLSCRIYRVAEVFPDGTYALTGSFAHYPVDLYAVTSQAEWKNITSTLAAYIAADQIQPDHAASTDDNGTAAFQDILPGMYLTLSASAEAPEHRVTFEAFLTVLPYPSETGDHNYDMAVYPKAQSYTPTPEQIEHKVVKQWKDLGNLQQRPATVTVDILKDGVKQSTQILSSENDWCYRWTAPDDGSLWQAVERSVAADYTVTVVTRENTIVITNIYEAEPEPPKTGETVVLLPYMLLLCFCGGVLILLDLWRMRKEQ